MSSMCLVAETTDEHDGLWCLPGPETDTSASGLASHRQAGICRGRSYTYVDVTVDEGSP